MKICSIIFSFRELSWYRLCFKFSLVSVQELVLILQASVCWTITPWEQWRSQRQKLEGRILIYSCSQTLKTINPNPYSWI